MRQAEYVNGFPRRMGAMLASMIRREGCNPKIFEIIHEVQGECQRIPVDLEKEELEHAIQNTADRAARECYGYVERYRMTPLICDGIALLCARMGVPQPCGETPKEFIARAVDRAWWVRKLRVEHKRRFEHMAIRVGFTSRNVDPYISRESALRQAAENLHNRKLLEKIIATNGKDEYSVAALSDLGVANKTIRRGEMMLRVRGNQEIAQDMGHVALFWTITCPSKYHSAGGTNKKYNGATPREAQAYLCNVWACIRSALKRKGIQPYGLRIAEPHTDGCPHWHMLLFVAPEHEAAMEKIIQKYALDEDGHEAGAQENRVKLVRIDKEIGTAAAYIVKYVSKNIDGYGVGDHKTFENGTTYNIATDLFGNEEITPSQRVTYWSQLWGIRQFQQIGGPPVGPWREVRRVKEETIRNAHPDIKAAWLAGQKIESDDPMIAKQASYSAYIWAQGGPFVGRKYNIKIAKRQTVVTGRYDTKEVMKPCGIYHATNENAVYESVRYTWTIKEGGGVAVAVPWTGVNNCTQADFRETARRMKKDTERLVEEVKNKKLRSASMVDWPGIKRKAQEIEKETMKFAYRRNHG